MTFSFLTACASNSTPPAPAPTSFVGNESVVYSFLQKQAQANFPEAPLLFHGSEFFGTSVYTNGQQKCCGAVYAVTPAGAYRTVHTFGRGNDGRYPYAGLILADGKLWGTTSNGGGSGNCIAGCGSVFAIDPKTDAETAPYGFKGSSTDGAYPYSRLLFYNGKLYGTAVNGGVGCFPKGCGTIFEIDPTTMEFRLVYAFTGPEGAYPYGGLIANKGNLYGTTANGGNGCGGHGCGTVFEIHPTQRSERVVYNFKGGSKDGDHPFSDLVLIGDRLWGTAADGGFSGAGTVFAVDIQSQKEVELYHFKGSKDGAHPHSGVILFKGLLYGTTPRGGGACYVVFGCGVAYSLDPNNGSETVLHAFTGEPDGVKAVAQLVAHNGVLYGTTEGGGEGPPQGCLHGCGIVFSLKP